MAFVTASDRQSRMTRQRLCILEELGKLKTHPTADELYTVVRGRIPKISLGTVYRNLEFLVEAGLARCIESAGGPKRFDADVSDHNHMRCVLCGRVVDCDLPAPAPDVSAMKVEGFASVLGVRISFEGVCEQCARNARQKACKTPASPCCGRR